MNNQQTETTQDVMQIMSIITEMIVNGMSDQEIVEAWKAEFSVDNVPMIEQLTQRIRPFFS